MQPHRRGVIIFDTITEELNKRPFDLIVPSSYSSAIGKYYLENNVEPIDNMEHGTCKTLFPISRIIDITFNGVEYSFVYPEDVVIVVNLLKAYLKMKNDVLYYIEDLSVGKDIDIDRFIQKCEYTYNYLKKYIREEDRQKENKAISSIMAKYIRRNTYDR